MKFEIGKVYRFKDNKFIKDDIKLDILCDDYKGKYYEELFRYNIGEKRYNKWFDNEEDNFDDIRKKFKEGMFVSLYKTILDEVMFRAWIERNHND